MAKIKITEREFEIEGRVEKGKVTPFGTSAHIPFSKKHTGKIISVVIPTEPKYVWLISEQEKKKLLEDSKRNVEKTKDSTLKFHRLQEIKYLNEKEFDLHLLEKTLEYVSDKKLVSKVKKLYNL